VFIAGMSVQEENLTCRRVSWAQCWIVELSQPAGHWFCH